MIFHLGENYNLIISWKWRKGKFKDVLKSCSDTSSFSKKLLWIARLGLETELGLLKMWYP